MTAIVRRWAAASVVALMLALTGAVAGDPGLVGAALQDPCEVVPKGVPVDCTPTATPDPCQVETKGVDPCITPSPTPTFTPDPTPTPDPGTPEPTPTPESPVPSETATPEPTEESCNTPTVDAAALGVEDCETPVVEETATAVPTIISGTDEPTPTPAPREPVTSLPSTGFGGGAGSGGQLDSLVPLLAALLMLTLAGIVSRRRLTR